MINTSDKTVIKIPFVKELLVLVFILAALYFANQVIEEKITMWLFGAVGVILLYLIITKPRTGFLIMIALLPLTAFPKIELGNFLKVSYLISLVLFLGFMAQAAIKKDLRISRTPLDFSFILLFVIAAVSIFQSGYIGEPQYIIRSSWFNLPFNRSN
ncbi:MAG: hypothetical protein M1536_05575, partial [Firmicutes bacterium]|nr:hypothetical protein [Bacillota bacterium]